MKKMNRIFVLFLCFCLTVGCFAGCQTTEPATQQTKPELTPFVDYVEQVKLDMNSSTAKQEVTVKLFVDGDTTHFYVPTSVSSDGIMKARYIAVNTPESTGQIEPWGKKASNFTREKLSSAESIIVESNDDQWHKDSSGGRFLAWIWYKPQGKTEYRNLNIELVQNGLSLASGANTDRYGSVSQQAYTQAKSYKLNAFSGQKDPDYYEGDAIRVDLKTLRANIELYNGKDVTFTGIIARNNGGTVYVEQYDEETDMYYGINVYSGYASGGIDNVLKVGNEVLFVGNVQYWEGGGTYQVTNIKYSEFDASDPDSLKLLGTGNLAGNPVTDPETFTTGKVTLNVLESLDSEETVEKTFPYAQLVLSTSIQMNDLYVKDIYVTNNGGDNDGAMTLTCEVNGITIIVRTTVLRKADKTLYGPSDFLGKTIDVTGIVDYYNGEYQIKVFSAKNITVH